MQIAEYYDSVAPIWDDDYAEAKAARIVTAMVSIHRGDAMLKAIVEKRTSVNRFSVAYQVP